MALPTVKVTGTYVQPDGSPELGSLLFSLMTPLTDAADDIIVSPHVVTATLNGGTFAVDLVPSDAGGLAPNPVPYMVRELFGASREYGVLIPHNVDPVDISTLAPLGNPSVPNSYDPAGSAAAALVSAEAYTDVETARAETQEALKQPLDADLTTIAALDASVAGAMTTDGGGWIRKTYAQLKTALALVKADVGLGSVDNTADTAKPVSTAQAAADASTLSSANTHADAGDVATLSTAAADVTARAALKANNLSDLASAATARTNLGLGTIATHATTEYLTPAQGNGAYVALGKTAEMGMAVPTPGGFQPTATHRTKNILCFGRNGDVIAVELLGRAGTSFPISVSTDGGTSWTVKTAPDSGAGEPGVGWCAPTTDTLLVVVGSKLYRSTDRGATWTNPYNFNAGVAVVGEAAFTKHTDGSLYIATYATSAGQYPSGHAEVLTSADDGVTWTVHSFFLSSMDGNVGPDVVRHLHGLTSDATGLYLTTGDSGTECAIWLWSGSAWVRQTPADSSGAGQRWRALNVVIRGGKIYWGRDASGISQSEVGYAPLGNITAGTYVQLAALPLGAWHAFLTTDGHIVFGSDGGAAGASFDLARMIYVWAVDANDLVREVVRAPVAPQISNTARATIHVNGNSVGIDLWNGDFSSRLSTDRYAHYTLIGTVNDGAGAFDFRKRDANGLVSAFGPNREAPARTMSGRIIVPRGITTTSLANVGLAVNGVSYVDSHEYAHPLWVPEEYIELNKLYVNLATVGSAGALVRLGVRADAGSNPWPGSLIVDLGTLDVSVTTGDRSLAIPTGVLGLTRGLYWVTFAPQGAPGTPAKFAARLGADPTIPQQSSGIGAINGLHQTGVSGALPTAWTGNADNVTGNCPAIGAFRSI